jgi:hypothetical protein
LERNKEKRNKQKTSLNDYVRFSAIGLEMAIVVVAGVWGGVALDKYCLFRVPVFRLLFSFLSLFAAMWILIRTIKK